MHDNDLKILSEQLAAAEDEILLLQNHVERLSFNMAHLVEVCQHLNPAEVSKIKCSMADAWNAYSKGVGK